MKRVNILIADDHAIFRAGVRNMVQHAGWTVCAEASTGRQAVAEALAQKPDLAIIDLTMPELNGIEVIRKIMSALPSTKAILLSMHHSEELARSAWEVGARAYVLKSDASEVLLTAINSTLAGGTFFTQAIAELLVPGLTVPTLKCRCNPQITGRLSPREREILQLLAEGKRTKEVATILNTSTATVETQRKSIMHKLQLHTVVDLVRYAIRNRLVDA
jgi:DNA-binding NarL/FixJ family response regulator